MSEAAAIRHYEADKAYNRRRRRERLAEGKCTMSFGCERPLATKYACRYHADINSQSVMRSRAGLSKKRAPNGELDKEVAKRRYANFTMQQNLKRKGERGKLPEQGPQSIAASPKETYAS